MIGKLQSNKTKPASELFDIIQTVHGIKLARRLNDAGKPLDVFLEVKLSDEATKSGLNEDELPAVKEFVESCANLKLRGLMGMPPWSDGTPNRRGPTSEDCGDLPSGTRWPSCRWA